MNSLHFRLYVCWTIGSRSCSLVGTAIPVESPSDPRKICLANRSKEYIRKPMQELGRDDWIRTSDLCVPNAALYQAEPHPELEGELYPRSGIRTRPGSGAAPPLSHR